MSKISATDREVIDSFTTDSVISIVCGKLAPNIHMAQMQEDAQNKFRQLVERCVVICSIKAEPDEYTLGLLWNYASRELSLCTFKEIETAVIFNQSNQYDKRVDHFQVFDLAFLSQVMENWFILKNKTRNKIAGLLPAKEIKPSETPKDRYDGLVKFYKEKSEFPAFWPWEEVFFFMEGSGLITDSVEEKNLLFAQVNDRMKDELVEEKLKTVDQIERNRLDLGLRERVILECRKLTVQKWIKQLNDSQHFDFQSNCEETGIGVSGG